jgi:hypothetical protein
LPEAVAHQSFYDAKKEGNGGLLAIYEGNVPEQTKQEFILQSQQHWLNIAEFILNALPRYIPETGFIGGERPGEDDFHVGAWLARVVGTLNGKGDVDGIQVLEKELGQKPPPKVVKYWAAWIERSSWKNVYADGLH